MEGLKQAIETALQQSDIFHLRAAHRGDAIIGFGRNGDLLRDLLTAINAVNHRRHGVGGALHTDFKLIDDGGYFSRGIRSTDCQAAHLIGDHCETPSRIAGPRRFDSGIQRQQIGLLGDGANGTDDVVDLLSGIFQRVHLLRGTIHFTYGTIHFLDIALDADQSLLRAFFSLQ